MTTKSMTGFAHCEGDFATYRWAWELRSVNGRGLDVRLRIPPGREKIEERARAILKSKFSRGSISASLQVHNQHSHTGLRVNEEALRELLQVIGEMELSGVDRPRLDGLLNIRGIVDPVEAIETPAQADVFHEVLLDGLETATENLWSARQSEGHKLQSILSDQVAHIASLVAQAKGCPGVNAEAIFNKLKQQIDALIDASADFAPDRLHQEAALMATKIDIREELDRLSIHVDAARKLLADDQPVGRRLDFLAQELNREANTICSKSNDSDLTAIGLDLKAVIDQMREQIQNVE